MKRLKNILKSKIFIIFLLVLTIVRIVSINNRSKYTTDDNHFTCTVINKSKNNKILLECDELIEATINYDSIEIGDILDINGYLKEFSENTNINLFNYKYYQNNKNIYYKLNINNYKTIGKSKDFILEIKRYLLKRIEPLDSNNYLKAFVLGDKSDIDTDNLKKLGIIHLFSISGMHVSFLVSMIDKNIRNFKYKNLFIISFLLFYYLLIKSISLLRCLVFFLIKNLNYKCNIKINKYFEIIISILLLIIIKPKCVYDIGFYYSVILSCGVSIINKRIKSNKYIKTLLVSIFVFLLSFPLNIYSSFEVNILSIIYNIIYIPFVTFILFPLSLLTLIFPFLDKILLLFIYLFEISISFLSKIDITLIFMKPTLLVIVIYYIIIFLIIYNYRFIYPLLFILLIHYNYNEIFKNKYLLALDVGQGDSILLHLDNYNVMIDTGGNSTYNIAKNITIPVLKSLGIRQIDYLILTHGDSDHMGEVINLVNNYKINNIIFNCGDYNDLENELIKELDKIRINYFSCIKKLKINKEILYFLYTREYDNENDNSNVIYTEIDGYKFMFMGDAGIEKEKNILEKYNISNIDVLKVGHHGSKTSSSEEFINEINPKYSIISVGKNNRYGHPNKEVLNNLDNSSIYRTDENGSIVFKVKNNKLKIETCAP